MRDDELESLRAIADTLIPVKGDYPSGGAVEKFHDAVHEAVGIMSRYFPQLEQTLAAHALLGPGESTDSWLRNLHDRDGDAFWVVSTVVVSVYVNTPAVLSMLNYPVPHRNPPGLTDAADDLDDGLLDAVVERGEIYVRAPD